MKEFINKFSQKVSSETLEKVDKKVKQKPLVDFKGKEVPIQKETQIPRKEITPNGKYGILSFLNIDLEVNTEGLVTAKDVENTEFTVTAPTGLSANEVEQFCDRVQKDLASYQKIIQKRQQDFLALLEHADELVQKIVEQKQESELASFIIESKTSEERLKEQLVDLRLENEELKAKLSKLTKNEEKTAQKVQVSKEKKELPVLSQKDDFDDILDNVF